MGCSCHPTVGETEADANGELFAGCSIGSNSECEFLSKGGWFMESIRVSTDYRSGEMQLMRDENGER
jgi:hypothetical protein